MAAKDTELKRMRDRALYEAYVRGLEGNSFENMPQAIDFARKQCAPQFFLSARTASLYIAAAERGESLSSMNPGSRARVEKLREMYAEYRMEHPEDRRSRELILEDLVELPAPEFYIGYEMAKKIIFRERRKAQERMIAKWQGGF